MIQFLSEYTGKHTSFLVFVSLSSLPNHNMSKQLPTVHFHFFLSPAVSAEQTILAACISQSNLILSPTHLPCHFLCVFVNKCGLETRQTRRGSLLVKDFEMCDPPQPSPSSLLVCSVQTTTSRYVITG